MTPRTPEEWLESQPLFPYRSRESLVKAAWEYATQYERDACIAVVGPKAVKAIQTRDTSKES